ncbi:MAG: PD40 domain-containing protein, partial [Dehalococcoidia bacterium]|nr:PD40 domain-containing protein [Dehalococcoidia bacterium]
MTPGDLYAITWVSECDISPDGRLVAFTAARMEQESDTYRSAIWVVEATGGDPRQFTAGSKRDSSPRFSPDGRWLAFLSERGEEKPQIYVMPTAGGEARPVTKLPLGAGVPA